MKPGWYARCVDIAWMGPFRSQQAAFDALKGLDGLPVQGAFVWRIK